MLILSLSVFTAVTQDDQASRQQKVIHVEGHVLLTFQKSIWKQPRMGTRPWSWGWYQNNPSGRGWGHLQLPSRGLAIHSRDPPEKFSVLTSWTQELSTDYKKEVASRDVLFPNLSLSSQ